MTSEPGQTATGTLPSCRDGFATDSPDSRHSVADRGSVITRAFEKLRCLGRGVMPVTDDHKGFVKIIKADQCKGMSRHSTRKT